MQNTQSEILLQDSWSDRARRLSALIIKEFWQIIRDPSSILISVVLPLLLLFLYGFGISLDLNHLRIGLVLEDTAPDARSFAEAMTNSTYFDVTLVQDRRQLTDALDRGAIRGFVVIPAYFSAFRHKPGVIAPIQVIADGSEPNTANFVQNYVQGVYTTWLQQQVLTENLKGLPRVSTVPRYWYNEELESRFFLLPGSLAIIMTLIGTLLTALVVAREWERGTMESMMATPVSIGELILGKLIPYFILGMLSMTICILVCIFGYGLPLRGSLALLYFVTAIFLFCALGFGLMISTIAKNQIVASQVAIVSAFLPSYMLSGFLFEISSMPKWIQWVTYLIPAKYFVLCLQTLFLVGNVGSLLFWNILPMLALGIVYYWITAHKTVKRLD